MFQILYISHSSHSLLDEVFYTDVQQLMLSLRDKAITD